MSRTATAGGLLWTWDDGDDPLAGTKGVTKAAGGTGLNSNFDQLDATILAEHNVNGTHKTDKIDGPNLKTTVADASTIELAGSPLKLRVKDDGIDGPKLKTTTADASTIELAGSPLKYRVKDAGLGRVKMADAAKPVTSMVLFNDARVAAQSAGSAVAAVSEWATTATAGEVKIECFLRPRKENRYVRFVANAKTDNAARAWSIELLIDDVVQATATGTNTSYNLTVPEAQLGFEISTGAAYTQPVPLKIGIRLKCVNPSTGNMKNTVLTVEATNAND